MEQPSRQDSLGGCKHRRGGSSSSGILMNGIFLSVRCPSICKHSDEVGAKEVPNPQEHNGEPTPYVPHPPVLQLYLLGFADTSPT